MFKLFKNRKKSADLTVFDDKIRSKVVYCAEDDKTHYDLLSCIVSYVSIHKYVKIKLEDLTITLFSFFKYMLIVVDDNLNSAAIIVKKIDDGKDDLYFKGDMKNRSTSDYLMVLIFTKLMERTDSKNGIC